MRTKKEIKQKLYQLLELERTTGNKRLKESRMSPRRQGKIRALKWILKLTLEEYDL